LVRPVDVIGRLFVCRIPGGTNLQSLVNEDTSYTQNGSLRSGVCHLVCYEVYPKAYHVRKKPSQPTSAGFGVPRSSKVLSRHDRGLGDVRGVLGLTVLFSSSWGRLYDLYLLILISAAAMVIYRPRKDEMLHLVQGGPVDSGAGGGQALCER